MTLSCSKRGELYSTFSSVEHAEWYLGPLVQVIRITESLFSNNTSSGDNSSSVNSSKIEVLGYFSLKNMSFQFQHFNVLTDSLSSTLGVNEEDHSIVNLKNGLKFRTAHIILCAICLWFPDTCLYLLRIMVSTFFREKITGTSLPSFFTPSVWIKHDPEKRSLGKGSSREMLKKVVFLLIVNQSVFNNQAMLFALSHRHRGERLRDVTPGSQQEEEYWGLLFLSISAIEGFLNLSQIQSPEFLHLLYSHTRIIERWSLFLIERKRKGVCSQNSEMYHLLGCVLVRLILRSHQRYVHTCVTSLLPLAKVSKGEYFGGAEINFMLFYAKHKGILRWTQSSLLSRRH